MKRVFLILLTIFLVVSLSNGTDNDLADKTPSLKKLIATMATSDLWVDVNRMDGVFRNNGTWMYDNIAGGEGLFWPKGTDLSPIFAGGQWLGAVVDGDVRVAGIQHSASEFQAGEILSPGVAANPKDGKYKWYTIYPGGVGDWTSWPVDQGAPVDADGDPLLIGDVTAFSVWNDLAEHAWVGTNKLNAEVRQTVFAFNRADALGDMIFIKWQIANKGASDWDSTYFSIWLDPDLGYAGDDLVGCDTTLGLGFCYNATDNDQNYGGAPPATGIDFFQGPIIDEVGSTVTLPDGTVLQDKTMLKMTSFVYYDNDDTEKGNPDTGGDVWNYFRGIWRDDVPITYGKRGREAVSADHPYTQFMFPGDPETETGEGTTLSEPWLDYEEEDRRFLMTTGPFDMPVWEDENSNDIPDFGETGVQEIVAVVIVARGTDNLNSVTVLKQVDELAQLAYDLNFNLANAPTPPAVTVSELPNQVVLTWDENSEFLTDGISPFSSTDPIVAQAYGDTVIMDNVEKVIDDSTYNFYGYTVYQYADAAGGNPVVLQHWDNGGEAEAEPYESQRFTRIVVNKHPRVGEVGGELINGKPYYFGVVAEAYLEYGAPEILTSAPTIITAIPQYQPGLAYTSEYNDTLTITHSVTDPTKSPSDGSAVAWVVDISQTTGLGYTVSFNEDLTWNMVRSDGDSVVVDNENQTGNDAYNIVDGLMVKVMGPTPGINTNIPGPFGDYPGLNGWDFQEDIDAESHRWLSWGPYDLGLETWYGSLGSASLFFGSTLTAADFVDVELVFQDSADVADNGYITKGAVYHRHNGYAYAGVGEIPFAAYEIDANGDHVRQLNISIVENEDPAGGYPIANMIWDMGWYGTAAGKADGEYAPLSGREYFFINSTTYQADGLYYGSVLDGTYDDAMYAGWVGARGTAPYLEATWRMQLFASKVNATWDIYTFTAPDSVITADSLLAVDLDKINVVPNPYYGYHSGELNIFERWVQFTYLPEKATISIYDLAGQLVRKLDKDDATTTFLQWDLSNAYDLPVASGVYIYVVETDYGQKIGKLAIFTPNERVDIW